MCSYKIALPGQYETPIVPLRYTAVLPFATLSSKHRLSLDLSILIEESVF